MDNLREHTQQTYPREPKITLPEKFNGDRKEFRNFINQIQLVFMLNPGRYPNDAAKVGTVGTLLTGKARSWFTPLIENPSANANILNDFEAFKSLMYQSFGDTDRVAVAENRIRRLRQGTRPAAHYGSDFRQLACDLKWNDSALISQFKDGLNDSVKDMLLHHSIPETLNEMITLAIKCDNRIFEHRQATNRSSFKPKQEFSRKPDFSGPAPMELDSMQRGPLSETEKQRRRDKNLCLYCGSDKHLRADCPLAKTKKTSGLKKLATGIPKNGQDQ